ncbi:hypothetical protein [Cryobacterium sp. PH31-O1]|uniref:hypothetical protein n=1 Tax=Cryobacterium sp. PH31-O1 TaxID=3046306 RepID=UPI0024BA0459|nr:hypothetical protein [Cryobacterium sp. PH31-O1]MDJ0337589.1 hypothetical protein [Cryobacterium sp. PH31-O1]
MSPVNDDPLARSNRQRSVFFDTVAMYEILLEEARAEIAHLTAAAEAQRVLIIEKEDEIQSNHIVISELRARQSALLASTSWRVTKPLRIVADKLRGAARS